VFANLQSGVTTMVLWRFLGTVVVDTARSLATKLFEIVRAANDALLRVTIYYCARSAETIVLGKKFRPTKRVA
jgi:hypothetical protein